MEKGKYLIKKYRVNVKGTLVDVTKKVYLTYYRSKRRDKYYEHDIKIETPMKDNAGNIVGFAPSKEDSLDRLMENGADFADECESVENAVIRGIMIKKLREALTFLSDKECELIEALYLSNEGVGMTERAYANMTGMSQQTIHARKHVILARLKKLIEKQK